jgi:uncharacterized membrane protein YeaQ/YmgE (transglycosylase-associated protein family)
METGSVMAGGLIGLLIALFIFAVIGGVIGAIARFVLPGRDDMSIGKTILYGIGGSILGGLVGRVLGLEGGIMGWILAIGMAVALIWFFTRRKPKA